MDAKDALAHLTLLKRNIDTVLKLTKELAQLDADHARNLPRLKAGSKRLEKKLSDLDQANVELSTIQSWTRDYQRELDQAEDKLKSAFGVELEAALSEKGLVLSGQYPTLKAGWFTLVLDFARWQVELWYGPRQERLGKCNLLASEVVQSLETISQNLGSRLSPPELLSRISEEYLSATQGKSNEAVPVNTMLSRLQNRLSAPHIDIERKSPQDSYRSADFSYDLYRLKNVRQLSVGNYQLQLIVATRAFTQHRHDSLWIPEDTSGRGTMYSHLEFKELSHD